MKKTIIAALMLAAFAKTASAQTFSATEFNNKLGKTETLCDTVRSLRIVSDTLTLLNMGGVYPDQKYTVAIKGNKISLDWTQLKGKNLCVTGVFILYKNRPEIEVYQPDQINADAKQRQ